MNNYKSKPFIPAIQKTSTLVILACISLVCFFISVHSKTIDMSPAYTQKVEAAKLMEKAMITLKESRMEEGVFVDIENDPNETG